MAHVSMIDIRVGLIMYEDDHPSSRDGLLEKFGVKVLGSTSLIYLHRTPISERFVIKLDPKTKSLQDMYLKDLYTICSKFTNRSRFDSQHNWGGGEGTMYSHDIHTKNQHECTLIQRHASTILYFHILVCWHNRLRLKAC